MALQDGRVSPPAHLPHAGIGVPTPADYQLPVLADVEGAHIGAMAEQQSIGVVVEGFVGLPYIDDLVLATGYDEALGELSSRWHNGQRVDELLALNLDGAVVGRRLL